MLSGPFLLFFIFVFPLIHSEVGKKDVSLGIGDFLGMGDGIGMKLKWDRDGKGNPVGALGTALGNFGI